MKNSEPGAWKKNGLLGLSVAAALQFSAGRLPARQQPLPEGPGEPPVMVQGPKEIAPPLPPAATTVEPLPAAAFAPPSPAAPVGHAGMAVLQHGQTVTLRVLQVLPADGLSPGERLLNGIDPLLPGDGFLAEVITPRLKPPALVAGTVSKIVPPRRFGRPGYVHLRMAQYVQRGAGEMQQVPWGVDTEDRGKRPRLERALVRTLLGIDGLAAGAALGASTPPYTAAFTGGGAGIGLLVGLAYSAFQRGTEPHLEPGDAFEVTVGTLSCRPIPPDTKMILYPATDPGGRRVQK